MTRTSPKSHQEEKPSSPDHTQSTSSEDTPESSPETNNASQHSDPSVAFSQFVGVHTYDATQQPDRLEAATMIPLAASPTPTPIFAPLLLTRPLNLSTTATFEDDEADPEMLELGDTPSSTAAVLANTITTVDVATATVDMGESYSSHEAANRKRRRDLVTDLGIQLLEAQERMAAIPLNTPESKMAFRVVCVLGNELEDARRQREHDAHNEAYAQYLETRPVRTLHRKRR
ncbi:hypothetical protein BC939DRAFT_472055 [Gamsiella multidivaricata]|uniref:uncharacterized protein n=1 Tax=Gamsiella multidivaricata TaxID=101098 RepID=UPI00221EDFCE|nr:uncharacterized protein BC939DRAFT_472055 [Gamsiella multidivaricata]KAI7815724.1 hypothetical protein BC939DRAFT_472055 [Gamsiella multidivaricata]